MSNKSNKSGKVPRRRFPEFRNAGEWEEKELREVATILNEKAGSNKFTLMSITAGVGLVTQLEKFGREIAGAQYKNYLVIKNNDFAYNKSATKEYPEGFIGIYSGKDPGAVPNSIFTCFRVDEDAALPKYLDYLFSSNLHGKWLKKFITVGARAHGSLNIDDNDLLALPVPFPQGNASFSEQQKIADCLSSLDDLITAQSKKLAALKVHKKGLMQQLFPAEGETVPKLRFPEFRDAGDWDRDELGNISMFVNEKIALGQIKLSSYVSTENILPDYQGLVFATKLPLLGSVTRFKINDVLISNIRPYLKKVCLAEIDGGASNDIIVVRAINKVTYQFLSFILRNDGFIEYVMKGAKGVKMPRGDISLMKEYSVAYPSKPEQQKIADCLSSLDDLITAQSKKLAALKVHKKGLMQQLFPVLDETPA